MTALLYTIWIAYTVGTLFFMLFWGTLFLIVYKESKGCQNCRRVTKLPKKDTRKLLLEIDEKKTIVE